MEIERISNIITKHFFTKLGFMRMLGESQERVICILAGGRGKRIGMDKAFVELCGKTLIEIALEKARAFSSTVVLSSGRRKLYLPDTYEIEDTEGEGPIAGIYSTLLRFKKVLFFPVDMPFLRTDIFDLIWKLSGNSDITVCKINGRLHPLVGVYQNSCTSILRKAIKSKKYSLVRLLKEHQNTFNIKILDDAFFERYKNLQMIFMNINSKEDLEIAKRYKNC